MSEPQTPPAQPESPSPAAPAQGAGLSVTIAPTHLLAVPQINQFANNPPSPTPTAPPKPATPPPPAGRRYGFLCAYCSSRLEAVESMAGQTATCPTCANAIVIPILDNRGRLIDPLSGKVIKQDPHPVHAYAAAGHKAPQIITIQPPTGAGDDSPAESYIKCPRCQRQNSLASNNCVGCGLPFTMEGTTGDSISGSNTWAVASLVLGIVGVAGGFCLIIPPILAIVFGFIAMRNTNQATGQVTGQGLAIAGLILGMIGIVFSVLMWVNLIHR